MDLDGNLFPRPLTYAPGPGTAVVPWLIRTCGPGGRDPQVGRLLAAPGRVSVVSHARLLVAWPGGHPLRPPLPVRVIRLRTPL